MKGFLQGRVKKPGLPPGSVVFTGEQVQEPVSISVINYTESHFEQQDDVKIEDCVGLKEQETVTWVNINGIHDVSLIKELGELVVLHPLIQEDLVNLGQRPKVEEYEGHLFFILKMLHYEEDADLEIEQVSLVVGKNYVISFQEYAGDVFEPVRQRLINSRGTIRQSGADYLAYSLIDTIVDHYFVVIEQLGERIEAIEESLLGEPDQEILVQINLLKREVIWLRKSIWPLREVISNVQRGDSKIFSKKALMYLSDVYDHTIQVIDMVETFRDLLSGLTDLYMSSLSQKMNEVMQFLTIVGTIFIPLTFIVGVYGMNFNDMPELEWAYGYPAIMVLMLVIGVALLIYFKRKKWI